MKKCTSIVAMVLASFMAMSSISGVLSRTILAEDSLETVEIEINDVNFPDANFRAIVANFDTETPTGVLTEDEIKAVTEIRCSSKNITNMKGIELFTELETLYCTSNKMTSLDVSMNQKLKYLSCGNGKLRKLVVGSHPALEYLDFCETYVSEFDVGTCPNLEHLDCNCNYLTGLDLSLFPNLEYLNCHRNQLTELDVSANPKLTYLNCYGNTLTKLDVSMCSQLKTLDVAYNSITELNIWNASLLTKFNINENPIKEIVLYGCPYLCETLKLATPTEEEYQFGSVTYHFDRYDYDVVVDEYTKIPCRVQCDREDVFILEEPTFTVTVTTDGNGTASASVASGISGTEVTLTAVPKDGYTFKEWQVVTGSVVITENKFTLGTENVEIKAFFEALPATPDPEPQPQEPDPIPVTPEPVFEDFIDRMYRLALLREPEAAGKEFWMNKVLNEGFTGGRCAYGFLIEAPEFLNRDLSNEQFIDTLYLIFFDRPSDADGKAFWMQKFAEGMTRAQMVNGFIDSTEWCNLCAAFGVKSGAPNAKAEKPSKNAILFATRLYTECLGREPEEGGLQFWALRLTNLECSGYSAALGFFTSEEFTQKGIGDEEFIHRLYRTFMGRDEDADGFAFWKSHLGVDMSREDLIKGFAQSQEFTKICNEYGIDKGI